MNISPEQHAELLNLLSRLREETIAREQFQKLDQWLTKSRDARRIYLDYFKMCGSLRAFQLARHGSGIDELSSMQTLSQADPGDSLLWKMLAKEERMAESVEIEKVKKAEPVVVKKVPENHYVRTVSKPALYTAILSLAALLLVVAFVYLAPGPGVEVATLTNVINAKWESEISLKEGSRLLTDQEPIHLVEGVAEITYDEGIRVVIEAPAEFTLHTASEMELAYGRIFAHVSERGTGFTVNTKNSKIIDLGTEFAVLANINGSTELHVFKGKTSLIAGLPGAKKQTQAVVRGQACEIQSDGTQVKSIPVQKTAFIHKIDSQNGFIWRGQNAIDLADIFCRGNGFGTGTKDLVLDPVNGKYLNQNQSKLHREYVKILKSYRSIDENPYIDGVFVPNGEESPVLVSSQQHTFSNCPVTAGCFHHYISYGPFNWAKLKYFSKDNILVNATDDPSIYLHANLGITYDLDKIRQDLSGLSIKGFETICAREHFTNEEIQTKAAFVVLVDGKVKFWSPKMSEGRSKSISVELNETDRFLTLIALDSQDGITHDRTYFVKPKLLIEEDTY